MKAGDFAKVATDTLAEHGVNRDDTIYLAGSGFVPLDEAKPYDYRLTFIGCFLKDDKVDLDRNGFTVDPYNLEELSEDEHNRLQQIRKKEEGDLKNHLPKTKRRRKNRK